MDEGENVTPMNWRDARFRVNKSAHVDEEQKERRSAIEPISLPELRKNNQSKINQQNFRGVKYLGQVSNNNQKASYLLRRANQISNLRKNKTKVSDTTNLPA
jgi:hypothetical protein